MEGIQESDAIQAALSDLAGAVVHVLEAYNDADDPRQGVVPIEAEKLYRLQRAFRTFGQMIEQVRNDPDGG